MSKSKRVPTALHSELTEYASLLRALRTQHTLDLSAHLSQLPPQSSQVQEEDSELDLSDLEDEEDQQHRATSLPPSSAPVKDDTSSAQISENENSSSVGEHSDTVKGKTRRTVRHAGKKRKRSATDKWTRWPLLAGDVYLPEWSLADEVQYIASQVLKQRRTASTASTSPEHSDSEADVDFEEDELDEIGSRALAASTAEHLSAVLSACSALVPRVDPILRCRLAPLNWKSVLVAASMNGLASSETLERVGKRLEALYKSSPTPNPNTDKDVPSQVTSPIRPSDYARLVHSASVVQNARVNLNSLLKEHVGQGDGDFLSFQGPLPPTEEKKKRRRLRKRQNKAEIAQAEQVKTEHLEGMDDRKSEDESPQSSSEKDDDQESGTKHAEE